MCTEFLRVLMRLIHLHIVRTVKNIPYTFRDIIFIRSSSNVVFRDAIISILGIF